MRTSGLLEKGLIHIFKLIFYLKLKKLGLGSFSGPSLYLLKIIYGCVVSTHNLCAHNIHTQICAHLLSVETTERFFKNQVFTLYVIFGTDQNLFFLG